MSSYTVYSAPFSCMVWTALAIAIVITFLVEVSIFGLPGWLGQQSTQQAIYELITLKLSSLVGQYWRAPAAIIVPSKTPSSALKIMLTTWLMVTATLLSVYQAAFSTEFTVPFPFVTTLKLFH